MSSDAVVEIKRKAKRSGTMKQVRKMGVKLTGYILPVLRYTLIPGCLIYSVYFTEPQPSFLELLNPFY